MLKAIKKKLKDQRGLTLVELLAVIVILGIIAAIAVPSIGGIINKSREDAIKADALQILNAAKMHVTENGIPTDALEKDDLETDYLDEVTTFDSYSVTVSGNTYSLTANGEKDGVGISFTNATKTDIDDAERGDKTIGSVDDSTENDGNDDNDGES